MKVVPFSADKELIWNEFVKSSKNGTFLFDRNFLDYHSERFNDASVLIFEDEKLLSVFPANRVDDCIVSHGGITYGGLVFPENVSTAKAGKVINALVKYFRELKINSIIWKCVPFIYHTKPSEEAIYWLYTLNAKLIKRQVSSAIYLKNYRVKSSRKGGFNKGRKIGLVMRECDRYEEFHRILRHNLNVKYEVNPVHTDSELRLLASRFPQEIKLYGVFKGEDFLGGAWIFLCGPCAHVQYLHFSEMGRANRASDFLMLSLIENSLTNYSYLDFGHSTEQDGRYLNEALIKMKEEYGGSAVCYDTYKLEL